ncbi:hypothetical protein QCB45_04195 [Thiomicrorhabdus sp. ZW0627]|uniref:hypothetical protein n=1 Tax=Thiomicrorhabdus sp. ZW0627 TaxID=3039774 RepID=UPI002436A718|nr:hypothetical protein [Thiomicrorhabdus sp. ZW0627]MDG6773523.1 hypothetical protein [Thiomicrorhabdus sp. ZW0627]
MDTNTTENEHNNEHNIPMADEMLSRLHAIDVNQFDITALANELKGNKQWISILTIPVSAILLVAFTLLGAFLSGYLITSFLISAGIVYFVAKLLDQYDQQFRIRARELVMERIKNAEGDFGLIPHFKHFLPAKYRHLWQSLRKGRYLYIDQYIQAIVLLQNKLDPDKFTRVWYLNYPEIAPEDYLEEYEE